ncbi:extracellular solute-binding protein [Paenibacillus antri]|uniref:Extracellular solute-binding protein n=1 Tax=Paenibacillus antri TaxID=2582848 RepID=A0A5R9GCS7_9BACL|nr:extracellular solute-binding protein [Paenibacillus antri]TLS50463.1 extracellular solute-binding protein [Paenibacillus antri]
MKLLSRKSKLTRTVAVSMASVLSLSALAACSQGEAQTDNTERVLRIGTLQGYGDDEWFRSQFTELFEFANPNIKIEIVPAVDSSMYRYSSEPYDPSKQPDPMEELKKMMQGDNPPDLVMMEFNNLSELVNENLLMPLDPLITADKFDTSKIVPTVLDGIKESSPDGKLYALAPLFSSSALFYNKKMFQDAGVAFPTDNMTWDQVFDLGRQLSGGEGENQKYGFSFTTYQGGDSFYEMQMYTQPLQLSYYDQTGDKMAVDSDSWENVWKKIVDLRKQKIIPGPPNWEAQPMKEPGPFDWDNFLSGRTAMAISSYYYINELINANKTAETNDKLDPIDWDVVTLPTHPEAPGIGGQIYLQGMMGINAKAQNDKDAWEFMKFVNGDDWARLKSRSQGTLVSNKEYLQPKEGMSYNIGAFYQLKPAPIQDEMEMYRKYPNIYMVQSIGQQKFQEVLDGKKEVRQALKEWQTEGDAMLQQMREDPNFQGGNWGEPGMPEPLPIDTEAKAEEAATEEAVEVTE